MKTDAKLMPAASPLRPADPRVVLVSVLLVVIAAAATIHTALAMLAALGFVCVWHAIATGRPGSTACSLWRVAPFALVIVALNAVLVPGDPIVSLGGHRIVSWEGLHDGIFFALRLGVMLMAVAVLIAGTAPESLAGGVHDLVRRVSPRAARRVALFVFLSMGFVPLFVDEIARIRVAQSFRGGDFSGGVVRRAGSVRAWLVPLLMSAVHRSGQLALAVELRQIPARLGRTIEVPRARVVDAVLLLATAALVVASSWSR